MKSAVFAFLLVIAGVYAFTPQEVTSSQNRVIDYWLIDTIEFITQWLKRNGLDPLHIDREFEYVIIDGLVQITGFVEGLRFKGISDINIDNLYYNIVLGRLDVNFVIPNLWLEIADSRTKVVYGDFNADFEINGNVTLNNIRLVCDALLKIEWGSVIIYNINPKFSIENIEASLTVLESDEDYSEKVCEFLNVTIPNLLQTYADEINTIIGELIRRAVNSFPRNFENYFAYSNTT